MESRDLALASHLLVFGVDLNFSLLVISDLNAFNVLILRHVASYGPAVKDAKDGYLNMSWEVWSHRHAST
jgi:hypothetical protein